MTEQLLKLLDEAASEMQKANNWAGYSKLAEAMRLLENAEKAA